jgi:CRISPR-associated protein Csx14
MPEHRLVLDPRNPGQFFACCGLFELSELLAGGGEAWFSQDGQEFLLRTDATLPPIGLQLESPSDDRAKPDPLESLVLSVGGKSLSLNWWRNETLTDKSSLKTWGGKQTPRRVLDQLLPSLDTSVSFAKLFEHSTYTKSRFGVDARSAWEAIDAGYSPNDLQQPAVTFPWVEVLAVAGLQGFRPMEGGDLGYRRARYAVWLTPLPLVAARAACAAPWPGLPSRVFRFEIAGRGQGYKTFLLAEGEDGV